MTLKELKAAIYNEDIEKIIDLSKTTPTYNNLDEAIELQKYIEIAKKLIKNRKNKLAKDLIEMKKIKQYNY